MNIAKKYGIDFHVREPYYASSKCPNNEFWGHIAENTKTDYILFTHCTNPLVKSNTYENMIKTFLKDTLNSSIISKLGSFFASFAPDF